MKEHVIETVEVTSRNPPEDYTRLDAKLNPYLKLGWVIIADWRTDYGSPEHRNETAHILLGWIDRSRLPIFPSKEE